VGFDFLRTIRTRLANLVSRGVVKRVDDTKKLQLLQVGMLADETRSELERVQSYGFTSVPLAGAEAVTVFVGGYRDHGLVVAVDDRRYRLRSLEAGEVAIYTDQGDKVVLERGGTIRVTASTKVVVAAPLVELAGNTDAAARASLVLTELSALRATVAALVTAYNAHVHVIAAGPPITAAPTITLASPPAAVASMASTKVKLS
jgi:phage baseplate assembly protein V